MSNYDPAFDHLMELEGETFTNDPSDNGGATKFGLTINFLKALDNTYTVDKLKNMDKDDAKGIYQESFWQKYGFDEIHDQALATKCFDMFVHMGPAQACRIIQKGINDTLIPIDIDGHFGPQTKAALNSPKRDVILSNIRIELILFYKRLVALNPKNGKFLKGWINRANA